MISDERMAEAAEELFQAMLNSLPNEDECTHEFSERFERKMKRLIRQAKHPVRHRVLQKVASIALVILIGFATVLAVSPTARAAFFGWIKEQYDSFTNYYYEGTVQEDPTSYRYALSELPDGFEEVSILEIPSETMIIYANHSNNQILHFTYSQESDRINHNIESAEYTMSTVYVNDATAFFYEAKDTSQANAIVWVDLNSNTLFRISAFWDLESLIQIAENIIKIPT